MNGRWYDFPAYCKEKYGRRLYRAALDAGFTCPNRDGTLGTKGCIFCDEGGSGDFAVHYDGQSLTEEDLIYNSQKAGMGNYIAYFQAFTNTYGPLERLRHLYTKALENPLFAGISIATRPDCLGTEVIKLLDELKRRYPDKFIWVELGLQSVHEKTALFIRRGYPLSVFDDAVMRLHEIDVEVIVHVILGLPYENTEMMLETVKHINALPVSGVKLQLLQYLKGTDLGDMYLEGKFNALQEEEYVSLIVMCLGYLRRDIVIHRLTGDGAKELLEAPLWANDKKHVLNRIRHEMKVKDIRQGDYYEKRCNF